MRTLKNEIETWEELKDNMKSPMGLINSYSDYIDLLRQAPKIGDFVPCNEDGEVLETPETWGSWNPDSPSYEDMESHSKYEEAQFRVKWQGWEHAESGTIVNRELSISIYTTADGGLCTHDKQLLTYSDLTDMGLIFKR